ncbi:MAG: hypothetical protein JWO13_2400 [Acidobacteriales bacterium]|nr:hypothetical protein [Terriglobales bacterium]
MTTLLIFILTGLLCSAISAYFVKGQVFPGTTISCLHECTTHIDLDAFQNLINPENQRFYESKLSGEQLKRWRRERDRIVMAYLKVIASNAARVLYVAQQLREDPIESTRVAAEKVTASALRLRMNSLVAMARIHLSLIFPLQSYDSVCCAVDYPSFVSSVMWLVMQQDPRQTTSVLSAL